MLRVLRVSTEGAGDGAIGLRGERSWELGSRRLLCSLHRAACTSMLRSNEMERDRQFARLQYAHLNPMLIALPILTSSTFHSRISTPFRLLQSLCRAFGSASLTAQANSYSRPPQVLQHPRHARRPLRAGRRHDAVCLGLPESARCAPPGRRGRAEGVQAPSRRLRRHWLVVVQGVRRGAAPLDPCCCRRRAVRDPAHCRHRQAVQVHHAADARRVRVLA